MKKINKFIKKHKIGTIVCSGVFVLLLITGISCCVLINADNENHTIGQQIQQDNSNNTQNDKNHQHNWVEKTEQKWVVDEAAHNEVQTIEREPVIRNGREFRNFDFVDVWVPEKGHYETVVTGYVCDCGATK